MRTRTKKTVEQIQKANLNKSLDRLKHKVADREELWLDWFSETVSNLINRNYDKDEGPIVVETLTEQASAMASAMLDKYEERWGKG